MLITPKIVNFSEMLDNIIVEVIGSDVVEVDMMHSMFVYALYKRILSLGIGIII
jgi:hypothetical protein